MRPPKAALTDLIACALLAGIPVLAMLLTR